MEETRKELISVVVPVYKVEKYIDRCIESILYQTYDDIELILVDDGSPDSCGEICDKYADKYSFIKVVHQENRGLAQARKRGIQEASGLYITFVDSDDYIHEQMLEKMHLAAVERESDMVVCQYMRVDNKGNESVPVQLPSECILCGNQHESAKQMYETRWLSASACGKLIIMELARTLNFQSDLAIGEEHDMVSQLVKSARNVCVINDPFYFYYIRKDSISRGGYNFRYYNSLHNYIRLRNDDCKVFPELKDSIIAFYAEYEMAVLTAMCRSREFDETAIAELRKELKFSVKAMLKNKGTRFYYKVSAMMILYVPWLFIAIFRVVRKLFYR